MSIGNLVAQEMASIVDSEQHRNLFKLASSDQEEEKCCKCMPKCEANCQCCSACKPSCKGCQELKTKADLNEVIDTLIKSAMYLDEVGFDKAAYKTSKALNSLLKELDKKANHGCSSLDCSNDDDQSSKSEWLDSFLSNYDGDELDAPSGSSNDVNDVRATDFMTDEELANFDASDSDSLGKSDLIDIDLPQSKSFSFPKDPHETDENIEFDINQFVHHSFPEDEGEIPLEDEDVEFISKHPTHVRNTTQTDFEGPYILDEGEEVAPLPNPPPQATTGYNEEILTEDKMLPEAWGREGDDTLIDAKKAFKELDKWIAKHANDDSFEDD